MKEFRVAHLGDSHFYERGRLDDNRAVHAAFIEQAREAQVDLILHSGDFFHKRSTPAERNALVEFLTRAADVASVVGVKGNHDADDDLDIFNSLDTHHPVEILSRAGIASKQTGVICLPWFSKAHIVSKLPAEVEPANTTEATIIAANSLLATLSVFAKSIAGRGDIPLFVGHVQIAGSETSTGQTLVGTTVELAPSNILEVGCAYAALGHVHKAQSWCDGRVAYSGSPQRMNFGEPEPKGWNLVKIDPNQWWDGGVDVEFQELPARRILLLEFDWTHWAEGKAPGTDRIDYIQDRGLIKGALVRFRYTISPEDLHYIDDEALAESFRKEGAADITIDTVLAHKDRVRSKEIATAANVWEKCLAYWKSKDVQLSDANMDRVKAKLEKIEGAR